MAREQSSEAEKNVRSDGTGCASSHSLSASSISINLFWGQKWFIEIESTARAEQAHMCNHHTGQHRITARKLHRATAYRYRAARAYDISCDCGLIYVCKGQGQWVRIMMPTPQMTLHCMRFGAFGCQAPHPHLVRLECIGDSGRRLRRGSTDRLSGQRQRRKLPEGTRARGALSGRGA